MQSREPLGTLAHCLFWHPSGLLEALRGRGKIGCRRRSSHCATIVLQRESPWDDSARPSYRDAQSGDSALTEIPSGVTTMSSRLNSTSSSQSGPELNHAAE